jgi:hypothetical protein
MKKARVIVKTVSSRHKIFVERPTGESTLYAVTDKLPKAKDLVLQAKRELGIARGSHPCAGLKPGTKIRPANATLSTLWSGSACGLTADRIGGARWVGTANLCLSSIEPSS